MIVMKFGGTSVANAEAIKRLVAFVARERRPRVVVVSALSGVTDRLLEVCRLGASVDSPAAMQALDDLHTRHQELARALATGTIRAELEGRLKVLLGELRALVRALGLLRECSPRSSDAVVACGELLSSRIVAAALDEAAMQSEWIDARQVVITDGTHSSAAPLLSETAERMHALIRPRLEAGRTVVMGGFVGSTPDGATTTLGRGGSDYSAALVGGCLDAEEIQIWTDVDGMLTADPRIVSNPRLLEHLSFAEASALARFGAKVLHPATLEPAMTRDIPVRILNSRRLDAQVGTLITRAASRRQAPIAGFASKSGLAVVEVRPGAGVRAETALERVFGALARAGLTADLIVVSDEGVSLAVPDGPAVATLEHALTDVAEVRCRPNMAILCVVGDELREGASACGRLLAALEGVHLVIVSHASDTRTLACVVPEAELGGALARLHDRYFGEADGGRVNNFARTRRTAG